MAYADRQELSRKKVAIRLLYGVLFLVVLEVLKFLIQLSFFFQYVYLFATLAYSEPLRRFSNKVSIFAYRVMRYLTLNENVRPFPFSEFPPEADLPEKQVRFE